MATDAPDLTSIAESICAGGGYSLFESRGAGTFKRVFRVEDRSGASYALKVLREPSLSERTRREADALARCSHPSIARIHTVDIHDYHGTPYAFIVEEYLQGGTLSTRINGDGLLDRRATLALGGHLIDALVHLEGLDLVHRDIKPDNIMFRGSAEPVPVLVDFGLVRDLSAVSLTHTWADRGPGTPYFAAPEQLNNQKRLIDWRTDQFSLGVSLAFSHYGEHPYQANHEPLFSAITVEHVARRGRRSESFLERATRDRLACLEQMTLPWPIRRFRRPSMLLDAWRRQET